MCPKPDDIYLFGIAGLLGCWAHIVRSDHACWSTGGCDMYGLWVYARIHANRSHALRFIWQHFCSSNFRVSPWHRKLTTKFSKWKNRPYEAYNVSIGARTMCVLMIHKFTDIYAGIVGMSMPPRWQ